MEDEVVKLRIKEVEETIKDLIRLVSKPFSSLSVDELNSMKYNIIVLVEALVALCIHVAREQYNYTPRTYTDAVRYILERIGLTECVEDLVVLVRLRNLLIHRYWIIDDHKVYASVKEDFKCIDKLLEALSK